MPLLKKIIGEPISMQERGAKATVSNTSVQEQFHFSDAGEQLSGKEIEETLTAPDGEVLYSAKHRVKTDNTLETVSEKWNHEPTKCLNKNLIEGRKPPIAVKSAAPGAAKTAVDAAKTAVEAGKLVWDIIKDGKAVGQSSDAMTCVLSKSDTDPLNYLSARDHSSPEFKWEVNDAFKPFGKKINYVTIRLKAQGKYHAVPRSGSPAPKGYYLPSVYLNVAQCNVNWPCQASGSVNLATPSNIGGDEVNAAVKIYAKLTAGWLFQHFGITIAFEATGKNGFRLIGKE